MLQTFLRFFILVTFLRFLTFLKKIFKVFIHKNVDKTVFKWRETLVSNDNKATTFRQLNRTVSFSAHPVGIPCENGFGKISAKLCRTVRVFLYLSCRRLAHHSTKCKSNVFYSTFTNVFLKFLPRFFTFFNVLDFCLNVFTSMN